MGTMSAWNPAARAWLKPSDGWEPQHKTPWKWPVSASTSRRRSDMTDAFPPGFFDRVDTAADAAFYEMPRLVTHIDDAAIAAVGALYDELGLAGTDVLDLMGSWISHFRSSAAPRHLTVLGMNTYELNANPMAGETVVHDLNDDPRLPFDERSFDHAVCCVSVDYLTRPVDVFRDVARVLRPDGLFVTTFSNRLFPTKAIRGWLMNDSDAHCDIVRAYFAASGAFGEPTVELRTPLTEPGDPLYAVYAFVQ
jgi:SAM-dependent methyltransferase